MKRLILICLLCSGIIKVSGQTANIFIKKSDSTHYITPSYFGLHSVKLNSNNTITGLNTFDTTVTVNKMITGNLLTLNSGGLPAFNFSYAGGFNYFGIPNAGAILFKDGFIANGSPFTINANIDAVWNSGNSFVFGIPAATEHLVVGSSLAADVPSAIMSVNSTLAGFLPPRMTTTQRNAISSPAEGLEVMDITLHKLYVWDGSVWQAAW